MLGQAEQSTEDWDDDFQSWDKPVPNKRKEPVVVKIPEKSKKGSNFDEKFIMAKKV